MIPSNQGQTLAVATDTRPGHKVALVEQQLPFVGRLRHIQSYDGIAGFTPTSVILAHSHRAVAVWRGAEVGIAAARWREGIRRASSLLHTQALVGVIAVHQSLAQHSVGAAAVLMHAAAHIARHGHSV